MNQRRMINSSIWQDEDFASLSDSARLLFIGMFSIADDEGRLKANALYLKASIFMYDHSKTENAVLKLLEEITSKMKSVEVYEVEGKLYARFLKWEKQQTIRADRRKPSEIPLVANPQPIDNQVSTNRQPNVRIREVKRIEVKLREVNTAPAVTKKQFSSFEDLTDDLIEEIAVKQGIPSFSAFKIRDQMRNWLDSKGRSYKNYKAAFEGWVMRAVEEGKVKQSRAPTPRTPLADLIT